MEAVAPSALTREPRPRFNNEKDFGALQDPPESEPSADPGLEDASSVIKWFKSPTKSVKAGDCTRSPSPNRRSKGRHNTPADEFTTDFPPRYFPARPAAITKGRLWNEGSPIPTRNPAARPSSQQHTRPSRRHENKVSSQMVDEEDHSVNTMLLQPETQLISQEALVAEVKGIHGGLDMVEPKCIEVDSSQSAQMDAKYKLIKEQFLADLDNHIARTTRSWMEPGALIAISNCNAQLEYGKMEANTHGNAGVLMTAILPASDRDTSMENSAEGKPTPAEVSTEASISGECDAISSRRFGDPKVPPCRNVCLSSMETIAAKPLPEDWSLMGLLWEDNVLSGDRFKGETFDEGERRFECFSLPKDSHGRLPQVGSEDVYFRCPGFHPEAFDDLQSTMHADNLFTPGYHLIRLSLLYNIPRKFQYLAVLTSIAIPIVSANVGITEWAFGILASTPSTYVLANPPMPPTVDYSAEEIVWKVARGWGLTFGPVFAALLVTRLRTKYPTERRMYFVSVVFALSLAVMLVLLHFMRDDTWNVLDLLALCVCFCATATFITTSESRGRDTVARNHDEEEGGCRALQDHPAGIQPNQPPQVQGVPQPRGEE